MYDTIKRSSTIGNERRILIDEVNPSMQYVNGHDANRRPYRVTFDFHNPVLAIPEQGEMWIVVQYQNEWRLSRKIDTTEITAATQLAPGDRRLEATNNLYLSGKDIILNGQPLQVAITEVITPIYVGTNGVDGVDELLSANPHPYAVGDLPGPVPFNAPWTNSFTGNHPVSFWKDTTGIVTLNGGFIGGLDSSVVFTLPVGYRPAMQEIILVGSKDGLTIATVAIQPNGDVLYLNAR